MIMYKFVFSLFFLLVSFSSIASAMFYTEEEIQQGKTQGQSAVTLSDLHFECKKVWLSLTEERYNYKDNIHTKFVLVRMDDQLSHNQWSGEIALFPISNNSLSKIYKKSLGFSDTLGTAYESAIAFKYCPCTLVPSREPYVILIQSNTEYQQKDKGYDQFTTKCFIDFVKKHTDAGSILSYDHNPITKHIRTKQEFLTKPEFGFKEASIAGNYYLNISR